MTADPLSRAAASLTGGRPAEALATVEAHLRGRPMDAPALHLSALALHALGRLAEAIDRLRRAVAVDGRNATFRGNLGRILATSGKVAEAESEFRAALALQPGSASLHAGLANVLLELGRPDEAAAAIARALAADPKDWLARFNAGVIAFARGRLGEADNHLATALAARPNSIEALVNLGNVKLAAGARSEALALFDRALAAAPDDARAAAGRGRALVEMGRFDEAIATLARAETANPRDGEISVQLAAAAARNGDHETARGASDRALARTPRDAKTRWQAALLLPRIYGSEIEIEDRRNEWASRVAALADDWPLGTLPEIRSAVEAVTTTTNFDLNYQGRHDRPLQQLLGGLLQRTAAARFPKLAGMPAARPARARPRIGFVSAFLHLHSIYKTHGAWATELGDGFETHIYYLGGLRDEAVERVRGAAFRFNDVSSAEGLVEALARDELDAIVYPDIGMTSRLQLAAALPLAPVQCNGLGHPVTSGLAAVTHALSSALMEPADGDGHYTEKLVRLPNTASSYSWRYAAAAVEAAGAPERSASRARFLCAQNLQKCLPQHDRLFAEIAAELPAAEFHFIADPSPHATEVFARRLGAAFARRKLDSTNHCVFHPRLDRRAFFALNLACDVFLDTPLWSGNNTTHEAIACGLPVVTWPGPMMRARHAFAILTRIGCTETVAADLDDYVRLAVRAGRDAAWRSHLRSEIERRRALLYDDPAPIRALAGFLLGRGVT
jgi:predicted O-linked N-acetylglucosamine transferase (SPINDLY family)